jgi:hypothetical protein
VPPALIGDQVLLLLPGKLNGRVWHSGLTGFPVSRLFCPAGGQRVRNGCLLRSSLRGQNPQYVLTILGGSASVVVSMARTTPSKEDKAGTSSVEAPTTHALVARPGSKAPDDNLADDDPDLLNFGAVEFEIVCRMSPWLQSYWPDSEKPDCPVWYSKWSSFRAP